MRRDLNKVGPTLNHAHNGRVKMTTQSSKNDAITLSRMNISGHVERHM